MSAARRRRDEDDILAPAHQLDGACLVTVQLLDTPPDENSLDQGIYPGRVRREAAF